jgi:hypothetical protein
MVRANRWVAAHIVSVGLRAFQIAVPFCSIQGWQAQVVP